MCFFPANHMVRQILEKPLSIYDALDIMRDDQQRFEKTVQNLKTRKVIPHSTVRDLRMPTRHSNRGKAKPKTRRSRRPTQA
jgi:hypothetical protein